MKHLSFIFAAAIMFAFISCERPADVDTPETQATPATPETPEASETGDTIPAIEEQSPIKGIWKCNMNGMQMTLDYGDHNVKYTCYIEFYKATAIYEGTYTINGNEITHEFTSLTTKNSSKIEYYSPDKMPKEALLQDANTIIYMDNSYKRQYPPCPVLITISIVPVQKKAVRDTAFAVPALPTTKSTEPNSPHA